MIHHRCKEFLILETLLITRGFKYKLKKDIINYNLYRLWDEDSMVGNWSAAQLPNNYGLA